MKKPFTYALGLLLVSLALTGIGCSDQVVSELSDEDAAASLTLAAGHEIVMRPTVLGIGGTIAGWLGSDTDEWEVFLDSWQAGGSVGLSWEVVSQVETDESKAAQEAYDEEYAETPIGIQIPDSPEPEYEEVVRSGSIASESLADAQELYLPEFWPEGDAGTQEDISLIWISQNQYDELANTRETTISLGLFDETLIDAEEATEEVKGFFDQVKDLLPEGLLANDDEGEAAESALDLTTVEAEGDWGSYTLTVNDVRTSVRTIEASNSFASFTILANKNNPIILEVKLTPLAQGSLEALNPVNLVGGFSGYEVIEINYQEADET